MRITNLSCDYMTDPMGYDFVRPSLGWMTVSDAVNGAQSAYRIQVTDGGL